MLRPSRLNHNNWHALHSGRRAQNTLNHTVRGRFGNYGGVLAALRLEPLHVPINEAECRRTFDAMQRDHVDGVMISGEPESYSYRILLGQLALHYRLPAHNWAPQLLLLITVAIQPFISAGLWLKGRVSESKPYLPNFLKDAPEL